MTDGKKGWGDTVLGWFVVRDEKDPVGPGQQRADDGAERPPPLEPVGELPASAGGVVDFEGVFEAFGLTTESRDRLAKADGLLKALPDGTDAAVKRQIVEASLKAFGVPFEQIIETACEEIQALETYQRKGAGALQAFCDEAGRRVAALEEEIRSVRAAMQKEIDDHKKAVDACNARKLDVQRVLEFFGPEAVGRVVRDSPKLIDPSAPPASGSRSPR